MGSGWFVRGGGKVYGPIDATKLKQLAADAKIDHQTEVAQNHGGPWVVARSVKGLFTAPEQPLRQQLPSSAEEEDFVQQVLQDSPNTDPKTTDPPGTVDYHNYRLPDIEFPQLTRERLPIRIVGWFFTVGGVLAVGRACYQAYQMILSETEIARNAHAFLCAASLVGGMTAIGAGSVLRLLAGTADVATHIAKLLLDIRRQGRSR